MIQLFSFQNNLIFFFLFIILIIILKYLEKKENEKLKNEKEEIKLKALDIFHLYTKVENEKKRKIKLKALDIFNLYTKELKELEFQKFNDRRKYLFKKFQKYHKELDKIVLYFIEEGLKYGGIEEYFETDKYFEDEEIQIIKFLKSINYNIKYIRLFKKKSIYINDECLQTYVISYINGNITDYIELNLIS